jgi:uncharacterized protein (TIGR02246 family)
MSYVLCFLIAAIPAHATAADSDQNLKQAVQKIGTAYAENFNRQDAAGIAALYAKEGVLVTAAGLQTNIEQYYQAAFKAGSNHKEISVDEVWSMGPDTVLAMGQFHITGKSPSGAPIDVAGIWTGTDVREGGNWKVRMLSAIPKPPQPPK